MKFYNPKERSFVLRPAFQPKTENNQPFFSTSSTTASFFSPAPDIQKDDSENVSNPQKEPAKPTTETTGNQPQKTGEKDFSLRVEKAPQNLQLTLGMHTGMRSTLGTHTLNLENVTGGSARLSYKDWQLGIDASTTSSVFGRQWSYDFQGLQNQSSLEFLLGHKFLSVGLRQDWFKNLSFAEMQGEAEGDQRHSLMNQRIGTFFLQSGFEAPEGYFHRIRLSMGNDTKMFAGDGFDRFRTAQAAINYMLLLGQLKLRAGLGMDLVTGETDYSRVVGPPNDPYLDTTGLPFNNLSQGLVEVQLGASYYLPHDKGMSEFGLGFNFGPDTERIRHALQNRLVHRGLLDIAQVPLLDRSDRFKFDVIFTYSFHFDFTIPLTD
jgi:hypothetical protein